MLNDFFCITSQRIFPVCEAKLCVNLNLVLLVRVPIKQEQGHTRNLINPKFRLDIFRAFQIFALKSGAQNLPFCKF